LKKKKTNRELNKEANQITYSLRSTFFYRKLKELGYFNIVNDIDKITQQSRYSWEERKYWRITHNAWNIVKKSNIDPIRVFAHPKIILEHPGLIAYYRNVSSIPLKGVQYLALNVVDYEKGIKKKISYSESLELCRLFNNHISSIIESTIEINYEEIKGLMFSSVGCSIDGSWRNAIGIEAENVIRSYILKMCIEKGLLESIIDKDHRPLDFNPKENYILTVSELSGFKLKNQKAILFRSEPDISIIDRNGKSISAIEIKGGTDPAGALERLGAIKKSLDYVINDNPEVNTILIVSCITDEMKERIDSDDSINNLFNLTLLINDIEYRKEFLELFYSMII